MQDPVGRVTGTTAPVATQEGEGIEATSVYRSAEVAATPDGLVSSPARTETAAAAIGDLSADPEAAPTTVSYWDYRPTPQQIAAVDPPAQPAAPAVTARALAATEPVPIDGNGTNAEQRQTRTTPDGKPVYVDPLHQGAEVEIARERTIADAGFGQRYVSSDQLVLDVGDGDNRVLVTRNEDGGLGVDVNGETYDVRLAPGQELTIRSGAGNDAIEVAPEVTATSLTTVEGKPAAQSPWTIFNE